MIDHMLIISERKHLLPSVWKYGHFILASVRSELRAQFPRSCLGALWFIPHLLAQALMFSIIRAEFVRAKMPNVTRPSAYPIYLLWGIAGWGQSSEILTRRHDRMHRAGASIEKDLVSAASPVHHCLGQCDDQSPSLTVHNRRYFSFVRPLSRPCLILSDTRRARDFNGCIRDWRISQYWKQLAGCDVSHRARVG